MKRYLLLFVLFFTAVALCQSDREQAATSAATNWLRLIDAGDYSASWDAAAPNLQDMVTRERFVQSLQGVRTPLGRVLSRKVKSARYTTTLPGMPDGEYVVIQFETTFENKNSALETITPKLTQDGTWRVLGYYIR